MFWRIRRMDRRIDWYYDQLEGGHRVPPPHRPRRMRGLSRVSRGVTTAVLVLAVSSASAQEVRFLDCPTVVFFGPGGEAEPIEEPSEDLPSAVAPVLAPPPAPVLLFPKETLAPSTPPLMLQLLNEPTEANARLFLAWSQERQERGEWVQALLKQLLTPTGKE